MLTLIAQEATPLPPDPAAAPGSAGPNILVQIFPFLLIFFVMWFLVIRPQKKQEKEREARVNGIQKGDRVRTRGGIVAPVLRVKDDVVILGLGGDRSVEVEVAKAYVDDVTKASGASKSDGS